MRVNANAARCAGVAGSHCSPSRVSFSKRAGASKSTSKTSSGAMAKGSSSSASALAHLSHRVRCAERSRHVSVGLEYRKPN
jgi:hypothetical protein